MPDISEYDRNQQLVIMNKNLLGHEVAVCGISFCNDMMYIPARAMTGIKNPNNKEIGLLLISFYFLSLHRNYPGSQSVNQEK